MNVREFFELSAGKWFSQKTSQHLTLKQSEHGKSDLVIEILPTESPQLIQLCQQSGIDPGVIWGGVKYTWKGTIAWDTPLQNTGNQQGESIAIALPDAPAARTGKFVYVVTGGNVRSPQFARYTLGDDDALTFVTEHESIYAEERVWFESDNVRLRTTIITQASGESLASFYSEIRMGK
jgi:CpeS-like protein